jgi:2-polyprenyl-3-methyl-5-hydroxy-6-metoxy-1,4-benzoquinol methylase
MYFPLFGGGVSKVDSDDLKITDSKYGTTLPLFRCKECGFIQCDTGANDIENLYANLEDNEYIESSPQREMQFRHLLEQTSSYVNPPTPKVLDIGAGIGLFVKEARKKGWDAEGIEPSVFLSTQAKLAGIPVMTGIFPHPECQGPYDVIYMTDVIEHIENPARTINALSDHLTPEGLVMVVTPNVSSLAARIMGSKWWHYRIAHVGYYNKQTLSRLMRRSGLELVDTISSKWYFSGDYILQRLARYLPIKLLTGRASLLFKDIIVPVNFFDSFIAVYRIGDRA